MPAAFPLGILAGLLPVAALTAAAFDLASWGRRGAFTECEQTLFSRSTVKAAHAACLHEFMFDDGVRAA